MSQPTSPLVLHLPYQSPWEWRQFHQHFALRLLAGVESLGDDHYARSFRANGRRPGSRCDRWRNARSWR